MNKIFLVKWSVIFEMEDTVYFRDLVWANSEEEAKKRLLSEKEENVRNADGVIATVKVVECIPKNGIFHLDSI